MVAVVEGTRRRYDGTSVIVECHRHFSRSRWSAEAVSEDDLIALSGDLATSSLLQFLVFAGALLAAADVAADALVEQPEAVGHEVADVGEIEKRQWNADQSVQNGYQSAPRRLRRYVPVTCTDTQ